MVAALMSSTLFVTGIGAGEAAAVQGWDLSIDAAVAPFPSAAVTVNGRVLLDGVPAAGALLRLTRSGPDGRLMLAPVVAGADGSFSARDTPPFQGGYTYRVVPAAQAAPGPL